MKTIFTDQSHNNYLHGRPEKHALLSSFDRSNTNKQVNYFRNYPFTIPAIPNEDPGSLINPQARYQMSSGQLPNLWEVCHHLYHTFFEKNAPYNALQFIPVMKGSLSVPPSQLERFMEHPETNHVLIQNELLKVVLIHWKPGKYSNVHGHPAGGCVFKVLHGRIEEKRYSPDSRADLLAVSTYERDGIGYIDDQMAYHAVGNPFDSSAISLHVYTPGLKKTNQKSTIN